jgi:hypothetical protein
MNNIQIKIPKISRILAIIFFFLALTVIGYFTISEHIYCNSITGPKEACGIVTMLVNIPVVYFSNFYSEKMPALLSEIILVLSSSIFWALIGVVIGLLISLLGLIIKQIRYGSHSVRFAYLITIIILGFILFRFLAINFLI